MHNRRRGFTLIEVLITVMVLGFTLGAAVESNSSVVNTQLELDLRYRAHRVLTDIMVACYIQKGKNIPEEAKLDCEEEGQADYNEDSIYWRRSWKEFEPKDFENHQFFIQTIAAYIPTLGQDHRIGLIRTHYAGDENDYAGSEDYGDEEDDYENNDDEL